MDTLRALEMRHSVRSYKDKPITGKELETLQSLVAEANKKAGLHIQLVLNQPKAFKGFLASYGNFKNVQNYFAMIAPKGKDEEIGYYGQKLVLEAQKLGLNTCWVGGSHGKDKQAYDIGRREKLYIVIPVGYGETQGHPHKTKGFDKLVKTGGGLDKDQAKWPDWFVAGAKAAQLAPTATNQQAFTLSLDKKGRVELKSGIGIMTGIDEGIVKYNFEVGAAAAGKKDIKWK